MSAPSGSPPPPGCSNSLGIPDHPFGRPRMMLNMDLIESSSESEGSETLESLSDSDDQIEDDSGESTSSSSELDEDDSGQCSDADLQEEDEYDRIFNKGLSSSSNEQSADEEAGDESHKINGLTEDTRPTVQKRHNDERDPSDEIRATKFRRL